MAENLSFFETVKKLTKNPLKFLKENTEVDPHLKEVFDKVANLCNKNGVEPLFAAPVGSRVYGYNKNDSDSDTFFVFRNPLNRYISLEKEKEIIKDSEEDLTGYDIRRFFQILIKGSMNCTELLRSNAPFFFNEDGKQLYEILGGKTDLVPNTKIAKNYFGASQESFNRYQRDGGNKKLKDLLSIIRLLASAKYAISHTDTIPINFETLVKSVFSNDSRLLQQILELKNARVSGAEKYEKMKGLYEYFYQYQNQLKPEIFTVKQEATSPKTIQELNDLLVSFIK